MYVNVMLSCVKCVMHVCYLCVYVSMHPWTFCRGDACARVSKYEHASSVQEIRTKWYIFWLIHIQKQNSSRYRCGFMRKLYMQQWIALVQNGKNNTQGDRIQTPPNAELLKSSVCIQAAPQLKAWIHTVAHELLAFPDLAQQPSRKAARHNKQKKERRSLSST